MAAPLCPMPPASARPACRRPNAYTGKRGNVEGLEDDLAKALSEMLGESMLARDTISEMSTQAPSEVSTGFPSEVSTAAPSQSPSRRGSFTRSSIKEEDVLFLTPELPLSQGSRASSCTPQFSRPSLPGESPGLKSSPNARRRARKHFQAVLEDARGRNPLSPWLDVKSVLPKRNRELSLPCVEVGYWSVLDFEKTGNCKLSISRQEEVRRLTREMLRAKRGSAHETELAGLLAEAKAIPA